MRHELKYGPDFGCVSITFEEAGETIRAESGAMVARDSGVAMTTSLQGSLGAALKRKLLGGESLFQNTFRASGPRERLLLAPAVEGEVAARELAPGEELFLQSGAYIASTETVTLDTKWQGVRGFFAGGLFLLRAVGPGTIWFGTYGALHTLALHGDSYVVDNTHLVGFDGGVRYTVEKVGGLKSLFFSGEGLVCRMEGTGRVYVQTRNPSNLAWFLNPFRPVRRRVNVSGDD
jgi:uncharacterized protein (TIGR00266 family)